MRLFEGGIILPFQKGVAPDKAIEILYPTSPVRIPLTSLSTDEQPHIPIAEDSVLAQGDVLFRDEGEVPVYATVSGTFDGAVVLNHPQYGKLLCAELRPEQRQDTPEAAAGDVQPQPDDIIRIAQDAAIYDELDGVPLYEKLTAWQLPVNDTAAHRCALVADATENDIFGSASWAVLAKEARLALNGLQLAARAVNFSRYHIATMLPKAKRRKLRRTVGKVNVHIVGDEYPISDYADEHTEVFRIGIQACVALAKAVRTGEKHHAAVVTVAGDGVSSTRNLRVPFGTDISDILRYCGAVEDCTVVLGDAMTGIHCPDHHTPLLPGTTTLLVLKPRAVRLPQPCMGCGRCAAVCHARLLPYEIVRRLENMHYERLQHLSPWECDGCAVCSYICPAGRDVASEVLRAGETGGTMFLSWGDDSDE